MFQKFFVNNKTLISFTNEVYFLNKLTSGNNKIDLIFEIMIIDLCINENLEFLIHEIYISAKFFFYIYKNMLEIIIIFFK